MKMPRLQGHQRLHSVGLAPVDGSSNGDSSTASPSYSLQHGGTLGDSSILFPSSLSVAAALRENNNNIQEQHHVQRQNPSHAGMQPILNNDPSNGANNKNIHFAANTTTLANHHPKYSSATKRLIGHAAFFTVGVASWWTLIALSLEIPAFLASGAPEGRDIGTYLNLATQAGNAAIVLYFLLPTRIRPDVGIATFLIFVGLFISTAMVAELWQIRAAGRSMPLLVLAAFVGGAGCMTNAVAWEWAARYTRACTTLMSVGGGVSSCLASLLALVQNPGTPNQLFSVRIFFWVAASIVALAVASIIYVRIGLKGALDRGSEGNYNRKLNANNTHHNNVGRDGTFDNANGYHLERGANAEDGRSHNMLNGHADRQAAEKEKEEGEEREVGGEGEAETAPLLRSSQLHSSSSQLSTHSSNTVTGSIWLRATAISVMASLVFGWLPGFVPLLMAPNDIVPYLTTGQLAGIVGRGMAHWWPHYRGVGVFIFLECASFGAMLGLGLAPQLIARSWHPPVMAALNGLFNWAFGLGMTALMLAAPEAARCHKHTTLLLFKEGVTIRPSPKRRHRSSSLDVVGPGAPSSTIQKSPSSDASQTAVDEIYSAAVREVAPECTDCQARAQRDARWLGIGLTAGAGLGGLGTFLVVNYAI